MFEELTAAERAVLEDSLGGASNDSSEEMEAVREQTAKESHLYSPKETVTKPPSGADDSAVQHLSDLSASSSVVHRYDPSRNNHQTRRENAVNNRLSV